LNIDAINIALDPLTDRDFASPEEAWTAVALILEANSIEVPHIDSLNNEMLFQLKLYDQNNELVETERPYYLYVVIDGDEEERYHIYATIADQTDLDDMGDVEEDDDDSDE
jgi:hypothetical protein